MLLEFTVGNYRSFYDAKTLSLHAQKISENIPNNVANIHQYSILKTLALYGANSSGKSNLILALNTMALCVLNSVRLNDDDDLDYEAFNLLNEEGEPTVFEITFLKDGLCYRYGFSYSLDAIEEEWLFCRTRARYKEKPLFVRKNDEIAVSDKAFPEGSDKMENLNKNRLYLSLCAQLGGEISKKVISWFQKDLNIISGINETYARRTHQQFYQHTQLSQEALAFFKRLQLGFEDIVAREVELSIPKDLPEVIAEELRKNLDKHKRIEMDSVHKVYDKMGHECGLRQRPFDQMESAGTRKIFAMSGPIFESLQNGATLVVDELDAKMHPLISLYVIQLFNDPKTNPKNAQLIFTTHDTHMLSSKLLRRDQIWFTEKNRVEQTDLYCLTDIVLPDGTKPRNDANYERNYIAGRYGAIPYILND